MSDLDYPHPEITRIMADLEKARLEMVEDRDFVEEDVYLDGWHFRNCSFEHCRIFVKVGRFRMDGVRAMRNCTFEISGPAETIKALIDLVYGQDKQQGDAQ